MSSLFRRDSNNSPDPYVGHAQKSFVRQGTQNIEKIGGDNDHIR